MKPAARHCPDCDAVLTHPKQLLCAQPCWERLPVKLRQDFDRAPTLPDRRAAYRAILNHLRNRQANPELNLV